MAVVADVVGDPAEDYTVLVGISCEWFSQPLRKQLHTHCHSDTATLRESKSESNEPKYYKAMITWWDGGHANEKDWKVWNFGSLKVIKTTGALGYLMAPGFEHDICLRK